MPVNYPEDTPLSAYVITLLLLQCQCHIFTLFWQLKGKEIVSKSFFFSYTFAISSLAKMSKKFGAEMVIKWFMFHLFGESSHSSGRKIVYKNCPYYFAQSQPMALAFCLDINGWFVCAVYRLLWTMTIYCDVCIDTKILLLLMLLLLLLFWCKIIKR